MLRLRRRLTEEEDVLVVLSINKYSRIQKRIGKEYVNKRNYKIHKSGVIFIEILFSSYRRNRRSRYFIEL